jgi:YidC/Oxa1 family membrane protein insertase
MTSFGPGFLGMGGDKTELVSDNGDIIQWAALKTQFFTLIVNMNDRPGQVFRGVPQRLPELKDPETGVIPDGIRGTVEFPGFQVNASFSQKFSIYAGPKEDSRLRKMGTDEDRLMQFGVFGVISRPLLMLMNGINTIVHNYGISIILMTIILRSILWYPQTKANLSMKRMQTVAPLMKEIQEKFKDKPEKMNQEMMKLYQDYGVNPFGGCLPLLIQFPIFLGFYYMLLGSIELRHAGFLWIDDLAQPDTVLRISALSWVPIFQGNINPMPLVMAVTMYISMSITPQPTGVDNPMMKVMKFMPAMFLIFCYNFASALSLYWTMQNLLSIVQMKYNMKKEPPTLEALKEEAVRKKKARKERMKGFGMSARGKK